MRANIPKKITLAKLRASVTATGSKLTYTRPTTELAIAELYAASYAEQVMLWLEQCRAIARLARALPRNTHARLKQRQMLFGFREELKDARLRLMGAECALAYLEQYPCP